jgi:hypothetical protein
MRGVFPDLISKVEARIRDMEAKAAAGQVKTKEQAAHAREIERFKRRRLILMDSKFPNGQAENFDPTWGAMSDRYLADAATAGIMVDDSYVPVTQPSEQAEAPQDVLVRIKALEPKLRLHARDVHRQVEQKKLGSDSYQEQVVMCLLYGATLAKIGLLVTNSSIDKVTQYTDTVLPVWSDAMKYNRVRSYEHDYLISVSEYPFTGRG